MSKSYIKRFDDERVYRAYYNNCRKSKKVQAVSGGFSCVSGKWEVLVELY